MTIPSEIQSLVARLEQELGEIEREATEGLNLVRPIMKQLPDEKTLLELLDLARDAEKKAKALCDLTAEIDEKL
jgi:hypothetical protein